MIKCQALVVIVIISSILGAAVWSRAAPQGAPVSDIVRTRRLELVDQAGTVRAILGTDDNRQTRLKLTDESGKDRAILEVNFAGDSSLDLLDADGRVRASIHAGRLGNGFSAYTREVKAAESYRSQSIGMGTYSDGSAQLAISTSNTSPSRHVAGGKSLAKLGADEKGNASFFVSDNQSPARIHMRLTENSEPSITLYNSKNKASWSTPRVK